ncbi:low-specificity L-threonine aldolase [candidate division KSB1 bacterium]|nr:low-specificity L-threonine aldolase [candidate division KSB1 bacterium]
MKYIDLRSDTVTRPSPEMRKVMSEAEVGDDVWGDDPTVNRLQERVAGMLGMEAALFVPSGSMANSVSILAHTSRGDEVLMEKESHTFNYEVAAPAVIGGLQVHPLIGKSGVLEPEQIESAIRPMDVHNPSTKLVVLENTHNRGGGKIYPLDKFAAIREIANKHNLAMHLDGARIFNACVATGISPKEYARHFDSLMFCFSKGLGAPVGSIVAGSKEFIEKAHRYRKMLGGGMRQIGILAAAADYALDHNVERLQEDHEHAQILANALASVKDFSIDPSAVETNIIIFEVNGSLSVQDVIDRLAEKGVLMIPFGSKYVRAVTHLDVSREDVEFAAKVAQEIF